MRPKVILEGIEGAIFVGLTVLLAPVIRTWYSKWGSTEAEVSESVAGDEFVPHPKTQLTMAVTIHAPPQDIWPWFGQLGCQRGGWKSYDLLDNGGIPCADQIIPEFQNLEVGDIVQAMPKGIVEPLSFVLGRKTLLKVKERAENM